MQTAPDELAPIPDPSSTVQAEPEPAPPAAKPEQNWGLGLLARDLVVSSVAIVLIMTFLYQPVRVEGTSMMPGLEDHERLFINKVAYRFGSINRGDIIVFLYPRDESKSYIKRVIALPGDHIRIDHGRVFVNGKFLPEPYVPRRFRDEKSLAPMVVPPGNYFVLGDHRDLASDSRDFGPVPRRLIYGKAAFAYWPADMIGAVR